MLEKYFIAIVPPEPLLSEIQTIKKEVAGNYKSKGALRSLGHITLHMPFSLEEKKEEKLIATLASFSFDKEVPISLHNFDCFEPRVIFINVIQTDDLFELQKKLVQHVKKHLQLFNQSDDMRGFHPHITIAFRDLKKPTFYLAWDNYKDRSFNSSFYCNSICLLKQINDQWEVYREFKI